jgi:acetyl-CoA acetyltransferase
MERVVIAGVGIHPFGRFESGYRQIGAVAASQALKSSGIELSDLDAIFVANVGGEMAKGHNVIEQLGRPGIPIINVEAACASSAGSLAIGAGYIEGGAAKIVLCLGVEKAPRGFIANCGYEQWQNESGLGVNPIYFALGAQDLINHYDVTVEDLADVAVKNHGHSVHNPNAMYRKTFTREEVLASKPVCDPLTVLMLCAPNEGAAAAVLMSRDEAARRNIDQPISLRAVSVVSRGVDDWFLPAVTIQTNHETHLTERAAAGAYEQAGIGPSDLDLVECQDTDSASELIAYRELGLCPPGDEAKLLRSGTTTLGGSLPVNASGGLLSKGEPLGASGLGQLHELVTQIRGQAGPRQVENARTGLSHVIGAGGTVGVVVVSR